MKTCQQAITQSYKQFLKSNKQTTLKYLLHHNEVIQPMFEKASTLSTVVNIVVESNMDLQSTPQK